MNGFNLRFRNSRRIVVVTHYGSFALAFAWYALIVKLHSFNSEPMAFTELGLCCLYLASGLMLATVSWPYGVSGARPKARAKMDERQLRVRADALAYSYWLTSSLVFIAFTWLAIADFTWGASHPAAHLWLPTTARQWWWVFWIGVMVNSMFPSAIIAWNEPDMAAEPATEQQIVRG